MTNRQNLSSNFSSLSVSLRPFMVCVILPRNELTTDKWDEHRFVNVVRKKNGSWKRFFNFALSMTDLARKVVIARNEAILMRTLVAIVVRLLRRLKSLLAMTILRGLKLKKRLCHLFLILYNELTPFSSLSVSLRHFIICAISATETQKPRNGILKT